MSSPRTRHFFRTHTLSAKRKGQHRSACKWKRHWHRFAALTGQICLNDFLGGQPLQRPIELFNPRDAKPPFQYKRSHGTNAVKRPVPSGKAYNLIMPSLVHMATVTKMTFAGYQSWLLAIHAWYIYNYILHMCMYIYICMYQPVDAGGCLQVFKSPRCSHILPVKSELVNWSTVSLWPVACLLCQQTLSLCDHASLEHEIHELIVVLRLPNKHPIHWFGKPIIAFVHPSNEEVCQLWHGICRRLENKQIWQRLQGPHMCTLTHKMQD